MKQGRLRSRLALMAILGMVVAVFPAAAIPAAAQTAVFINEIHYDNAGTDVGEAIEVAGPAGTDLTGWSLELYNGSGGASYGTTALSGVIPDQAGGYGTVFVSYATNGLQNGSPDGIALVDASSNVVQFLSYEGTFVAVGGPANGMTSTDIGVQEGSSTLIGDSLQLVGTGMHYEDFSWTGPTAASFGSVNNGQTFGEAPDLPAINEIRIDQPGTDVDEYFELAWSAGSSLDGYTYLVIGDGTGGSGVVEAVIDLTGQVMDGDGLFLAAEASMTLGAADLVTDLNFENSDNVTHLLVSGFTGANGTDLDTNDDGVLDSTPWAAVADSVGLVETVGSGDLLYSATLVGPDGSFVPGHVYRCDEGWRIGPFGGGRDTPGAVNDCSLLNCTDPLAITAIHDVQGSGLTSPLVGSEVVVEAVVTGIFPGLSGIYVQEEPGDQDSDPLTSEGVFVFGGALPDGLAAGDSVRVQGTVAEFVTSGGASSLTEISAPLIAACAGDPIEIPATDVTFPLTAVSDMERYEGMLVQFDQALVISEYFNFDRFGETVVALPLPGLDRHFTPTAVVEPGTDAVNLFAEYQLRRITIDDGRSSQNPDPAIHPGNGAVFDLTNTFRGGDTIAGITGVIDDTFGLYRMQPTEYGEYTAVNPRPAAPDDVGGSLQVAAFNVLNYFTTLDNAGSICGPLANQGCRGADNANEFTRQRDKIIAALAAIDADVVGLTEIENHIGDVPTADLVSGLNAAVGAGTYSYIETGAIGGDAIRVAMLYKPATVTPLGDYAVLDSSVDSRFLDDFNRPVLAQSFVEIASGGVFTAAVNHLKSKGSPCDSVGDPDAGDGQGNCNMTRESAAEALVDWLATDPTGSGDADFLIIGDLNSYDKEDPIDAVLAGADDIAGTADDYTDLLARFGGEYAYSYVFDGQFGYLDYGVASATMNGQVTGATAWHINADEPDILDYDTSFKQDAQDALYEPNAYRSSDHDPVIVGLDLLAYDFDGFFSPLDNPPAENSRKAGSAIPVKFSLGGFLGLDVLADGSPDWVACDTTQFDGEPVLAGSAAGLTYDLLTDQYVYVASTDKAWKGECRQLVLVLDDGSIHRALIQFK